jgi:RHS repeat-associated protein
VVITDRDADGVLDITGSAATNEVLQEQHYYAFGLGFEGPWVQNDAASRDNKYQYNGKELNDDFGLNWNDYGARWYDAAIGRWNGADPLAEVNFSKTPFCYALNNPLIYVDPDGRDAVLTVDKKKKHVHVLATFFWSPQSAAKSGLNGSRSYEGMISNEDFVDAIVKLWESAPKSAEVDGETYTVSFKIDLVRKDTHEEVIQSLANTEGSNFLFTKDDRTESKYNSGGSRTFGLNIFQNKRDKTNFSHEVGHAMGLDHPKTMTQIEYQEDGSYSIMNNANRNPRRVLKKDVNGVVTESIRLARQVNHDMVRIILVTNNSQNIIHVKNSDGTRGATCNYEAPK